MDPAIERGTRAMKDRYSIHWLIENRREESVEKQAGITL